MGGTMFRLKLLVLPLLVLAVFVSGCARQGPEGAGTTTTTIASTTTTAAAAQGPSWQSGGVAIAGTYGDADVVSVGGGMLRIYYSLEPEAADFQGQVYSATSTDGRSWTQESGVRRTWSTFPSVIALPAGGYRMYFQNAEEIKSATSQDGLAWTDEAGTRVDKSNSEGFTLQNVAAPTVLYTGGKYVMVYRATIAERYSASVPNSDTQLFMWAESSDGIAFEKKGILLDSRNAQFEGLLDGPELVQWDDGTVRLYFWSYKGAYHGTFADGRLSTPEFDYATKQADAMNKYPSDPPCDPTLAKVGSTWFMYYGQHTRGIYFATLGSG